MKRKHGWLWGWVFLAVALTIILPNDVLAQDYPTKPINLVVTFPPGGVLDATTRMLAARAEKILGQPVVVANVGGGGGSVALGSSAKEKPDGYHIVVVCDHRSHQDSSDETGSLQAGRFRSYPAFRSAANRHICEI